MKHIDAFASIRRHIEEWEGYPVLAEVMQRFDELRLYVAGGAVRNVLMGFTTAPKDFDFFLQGASISSAIDYIGHYGRLQMTPYGSPRWYSAENAKQYVDLIPIADFAPGLWPCENIIDVLNQFDFTANAVAYDLRTGELFDPQNGVRDTERRLMKMVRFDYPDGPYIPSASLERKTVLWFRIVHYASVLGYKFEPLTRKWVCEHQGYEVQRDEFTRIFFPPELRALEGMDG